MAAQIIQQRIDMCVTRGFRHRALNKLRLPAIPIGGNHHATRHAICQRTATVRTDDIQTAIDAITRSCRAGVPVSNTFAIVAEHLSGPLANEFKTIDHWLKLGIPLRQVIQTSATRVPMAEYRFFVVILIIN